MKPPRNYVPGGGNAARGVVPLQTDGYEPVMPVMPVGVEEASLPYRFDRRGAEVENSAPPSAPAVLQEGGAGGGRSKRLGDLLVEAGVISSSQLREALARQQTGGGRLGEILVAEGMLPRERLEAVLARQRRRIPLGALLVEEGMLTQEGLQRALAQQTHSGERLGRLLVSMGLVKEEVFLTFFARMLELPWVDLSRHSFDPLLVALIPEAEARRFQAVVLAEAGGFLLVGMADPTDVLAIDELTRIVGRPLRTALVSEGGLYEALERVYRRLGALEEQAEALGEEMARSGGFDLDRLAREEMGQDAPVTRLLRTLFEDAVRMRASDIHIEPGEQELRIRQRIDGALHEHVMKENRIAPALVSKLKLMAGLEISEKRLPQDGRFHVMVRGRRIDVRLATLPVLEGESVVMRLLDQSARILELERVGMSDVILERLRRYLRLPNGLVLVTGPTGSGKTTTLYGALSQLNSADKKIITVEDPVEYRLPRISQVQVRERIGLSFARVLRTVLRQDPDIILVGEMRDLETSRIAIRAALTGHLVLSTLHTNDAVSTVTRLVEMGVEGYAVAAAVRCILSQRLLRRVCPICAEPCATDGPEAVLLRGVFGALPPQTRLVRGRGCAQCAHSGYFGRVAVVEMLEMTPPLAEALRIGDPHRFHQEALLQSGYVPLRQESLRLAINGVTTLEEALRVNGEEELRTGDPDACEQRA